MQTKQEYLLEIPFEYILGFSRETGLIRRNCYFTKKDYVHRLLRTLNHSECKTLNSYFLEGISYKKAVKEFLCKYPTAQLINDEFVNHLKKFHSNCLGDLCFEFPISNTRVDILRLETQTYAYEIKSQRDKIDRLNYQLPALQEVFEYASIIIPSEISNKVKRLIQAEVGIITYFAEYGQIRFELEREPERGTQLNPTQQLNLLRIEELLRIYTKLFQKTPIEKCRTRIVSDLCSSLDYSEINDVFKLTLRNRSKSQIQPSCLQSFIQN